MMPECIYPYDFTCKCQECKSCKRKEEINQEVLWRELSSLRAVYMPRLIDKITQQMKDLTLADE